MADLTPQVRLPLRDEPGDRSLTSRRGTIVAIQYLRALAALAVATYHTGWSRTNLGASGVDLFFVISGFIMVHVSRHEITPMSFLLARMRRVAPLYWALTLAVAAATGASGVQVLTSLSFWPDTPGTARGWPIIFQGWTLNYEMLFYAVFAASLFLRHGSRLIFVSVVLGLCYSAGFAHPSGHVLEALTNPIAIEFAFGGWLCVVWRRGYLPGTYAALGLLGLGLSLIALQIGADFTDDWRRPFVWGVPYTLVLAGALGLERSMWLPRGQLLQRLGDSSFSLYLTHVWVIAATHPVARVLPAPAAILVTLMACGAVALLVHEFVERPLQGRPARVRFSASWRWPGTLSASGPRHGVDVSLPLDLSR